MTLPTWTAVIATRDRPVLLARVLDDLLAQTHPPERIVVVDASTGTQTRAECITRHATAPRLTWVAAERASAAQQRNQGARLAATPLVAFVDDDVALPMDVVAKLVAPFADDRVGGVAGRIEGLSHPVPHGLLWWYYRIQAGYPHPHYGARVIGPGINLLPAFDAETDSLVQAQWLNTTLVVYRRDLLEREQFPAFDGYSFLEDVHLSHRIGRTHTLYFHADARYVHNSQSSAEKQDRRGLAHMIVRHQRIVARDVLGLRGFTLGWKLTLHRLFQSVAVLRQGGPGRWQAVRGFWDKAS